MCRMFRPSHDTDNFSLQSNTSSCYGGLRCLSLHRCITLLEIPVHDDKRPGSSQNYTTLNVFIEMTISASDVKGKDIDVDDCDKSRTAVYVVLDLT